ncbi:MAG: EAL domain-containing protein [Pelomonas sp.]|nr:EAL domain-containing protein [Roseateles sp.]
MNVLLTLSAGINLMLGGALLLLWSMDRRHVFVRDWSASWMLLGVGLLIGPVLGDATPPGGWRALQSLVAAACLMGSLVKLLAGALLYRRRRLPVGLALPAWLLMVVGVGVLGAFDIRSAIIVGALLLAAGSCVGAAVMWRGGDRAERWIALALLGLAGVQLSAPLLDAQGRSPITYTAGFVVQTVLSLGLLLLSVARAHREVSRQSQRFMLLAEQSLQGLAVARHGRVLYTNPAARVMFGFDSEAEAAASLIGELVPAEEHERLMAEHRALLADRGARREWQATRRRRDGRAIHVRGLSSHLDWDGAPAELVMMIDDSSHQAALAALRRQALHDELTDLPNRNFAVARLRELTRDARCPPLALISADLDRFQLVNESLGFEVGDALLFAIARRLAACMPERATLARLGEDQFVVLVEDVGAAEAERIVRELLELLEAPFAVSGIQLYMHMSAGLALYPRDAADATVLLRAAESAMHRAKQIAGSSWLRFDPALDGVSRARLETEQTLGAAIEAREFHLEYQPKFAAGARALSGVEALVRWQRSDGTRVSPIEFIPAAERTGQIKALGSLVLELALAQLRRWCDAGGPAVPVAVNVSPLQFEDPQFAEDLLARLDALELPHELLSIEVTETATIANLARVLPQLQLLRAAGVDCALDDFGTGQSSLTLLRQLPIAALKLDRSLIEPLPEPGAAAIVAASCTIGRALGLEVVAEGVETEAQAAHAEALGCTQLQGFLLGRPMPAAALEALFEGRVAPAG